MKIISCKVFRAKRTQWGWRPIKQYYIMWNIMRLRTFSVQPTTITVSTKIITNIKEKERDMICGSISRRDSGVECLMARQTHTNSSFAIKNLEVKNNRIDWHLRPAHGRICERSMCTKRDGVDDDDNDRSAPLRIASAMQKTFAGWQDAMLELLIFTAEIVRIYGGGSSSSRSAEIVVVVRARARIYAQNAHCEHAPHVRQ